MNQIGSVQVLKNLRAETVRKFSCSLSETRTPWSFGLDVDFLFSSLDDHLLFPDNPTSISTLVFNGLEGLT